MQVKNEILKGIKWKFSQNLLSQLFRILTLIILFRLIEPQVFGAITLLLVIIMFTANLIELGFSSALIQKEHVETKDHSTIFWLHVLLGIIVTILLYNSDFSFFISGFSDDKEIFRLLTLSLLIIPASYVPSSILTKSLQFKKQAIIEITSIIISGLTALILAFQNQDILALTLQHLLKIFITTALIFYFAKWTPKLYFSLKSILRYLKLSLSVYGNSLFYFIASHLDNLLIGSHLGKFDLGIYEKPYSLVNIPANQITKVLTRVSFPVFARKQHDKKGVSRVYLKMMHAVSLLVFPISLILFVFCKPFVMLIFGPQWLDAIPLVRVFAITSFFVSINALFGAILLASGNSRIIFVDGFLKKSLIIIAILSTFTISIEAVALGILIAEIIGVAITFHHTEKLYHISYQKQIQSFLTSWKTVLSAFIIVVFFYFLGQVFKNLEVHFFILCCSILPFVYMSLLKKYERELYRLGLEFLSIIRQKE